MPGNTVKQILFKTHNALLNNHISISVAIINCQLCHDTEYWYTKERNKQMIQVDLVSFSFLQQSRNRTTPKEMPIKSTQIQTLENHDILMKLTKLTKFIHSVSYAGA